MIDIKIDTSSAQSFIGNIDRQIPYAAMRALNNVAFTVKDDEVKALSQYLDRPTPFTERGYEVVKATIGNLVASVRARQVQGEYLRYAVEGGTRGPKRRAIVVPDNVLKNQYGNMPKGMIKQLLKQKNVFATKPGSSIAAGIYERIGGRRLRFLVAFEPKAAYRKLLPFYDVAEATVGRTFKDEFNHQIGLAITTSKGKASASMAVK